MSEEMNGRKPPECLERILFALKRGRFFDTLHVCKSLGGFAAPGGLIIKQEVKKG